LVIKKINTFLKCAIHNFLNQALLFPDFACKIVFTDSAKHHPHTYFMRIIIKIASDKVALRRCVKKVARVRQKASLSAWDDPHVAPRLRWLRRRWVRRWRR